MTILENYLKSKRVQKALNTKPGQEGFSLVELVVVIAVLAILSAVAIPAFNGVQVSARASAVKNGLVNGVKECVILSSEGGDTTAQANVQSFPGNYTGYTIGVWTAGSRDNTCYNAQATPTDTSEATFWIEMDTSGNVTKGCDNAAKKGCDTGAVW